MKALVPYALEVKVEIAYVRRSAQHCLRFMDGYRNGLEGPELDYAMKKFSGKRRIPLELIPSIKVDFIKNKERLAAIKAERLK